MRAVAIALALVVLAACGVPRDPEGTLRRVRGGTVRGGYTEAAPWAHGDPSSPQGVEVELVEAFARELGARVEWETASEAELFKALEVRALDIAVGGFDAADPWVASAGMTRPYLQTRLVVGVPEAAPPPASLEGLTVAVEPATEAEGLLRKAGAVPDVVDDITAASGPAAVDEWLLDDLGLVDSGHVLASSNHVMAVPLGENGWLVTLERYLHTHHADVAQALEAARPS